MAAVAAVLEAPVGTPTIAGVVLARCRSTLTGEGEVTELWSEPWDDFVRPAHVYQSATDVGVVKCWHLHEIHTDQFVVTRGKLQISLVDVREDSRLPRSGQHVRRRHTQPLPLADTARGAPRVEGPVGRPR